MRTSVCRVTVRRLGQRICTNSALKSAASCGDSGPLLGLVVFSEEAARDEYVHDYRGTKDGPLFLNGRGDPFTYWGFMALFARLSHRLEERGVDFWPTGCATPESRTGSAPASRLSSSSRSQVRGHHARLRRRAQS